MAVFTNVLSRFYPIALALFAWGCVPINTHERMLREARVQAFREARQIVEAQHCTDATWLMIAKIDLEELKIMDAERRN